MFQFVSQCDAQSTVIILHIYYTDLFIYFCGQHCSLKIIKAVNVICVWLEMWFHLCLNLSALAVLCHYLNNEKDARLLSEFLDD